MKQALSFFTAAGEQANSGLSDGFMVKAYSPAELCCIYGVSRKTWIKWLAPFKHKLGERCGRYYTVLQVQIIIEHIGIPHWLEQ